MLRDNDEFETQYDCPTCRRTFLSGLRDPRIETGGKLIPKEAKLSSTPRPAMSAGFNHFVKILRRKQALGM